MINYLDELVEFLSISQNRHIDVVKNLMSAAQKIRGTFGSTDYSNFMDQFLAIIRPLYNETSETDVLRFYEDLAPLSLYRYTIAQVNENVISAVQNNLPSVEHLNILDYGCGLAYSSFELCRRLPQVTNLTLVDIYHKITRDFLKHLGEKYNIPITFSHISSTQPYPLLPEKYYAAAFFTEVGEHMVCPSKGLDIIHKALCSQGLLFAHLGPHSVEPPTHITPNLDNLRNMLSEWKYTELSGTLYRKS